MTIGEYLRRRYRLLAWVGFAGGSAIMVVFIRSPWHVRGEYHPREIVGFLLALVFAFLVTARLRCPRSRRSLFGRWKPGMAHCPHCGVSLDETYKAPGTEAKH